MFETGRKPADGLVRGGHAASIAGVGSGCFLFRPGGRFIVPACAAEPASRVGAVKDARKRA
jgi:hypothetical protein